MRCLLSRARRDGVPLTSRSARSKPEEGQPEVIPSQHDKMLDRAVTVARFIGTSHHELINAEFVRASPRICLKDLRFHLKAHDGEAIKLGGSSLKFIL